MSTNAERMSCLICAAATRRQPTHSHSSLRFGPLSTPASRFYLCGTVRRVVVTFAVPLSASSRVQSLGLGAKLQQKAIVTFKALRNGLRANCASAIAATREAATWESTNSAERLLVEPAATRDRETPSQRHRATVSACADDWPAALRPRRWPPASSRRI